MRDFFIQVKYFFYRFYKISYYHFFDNYNILDLLFISKLITNADLLNIRNCLIGYSRIL